MESNFDKNRHQELAEKWLNGSITPEEAEEYNRWYNDDDQAPLIVPGNFAESRETHRQRIMAGIAGQTKPAVSIYRRAMKIASAAAIILMFAGAAYRWLGHSPKQQNATAQQLLVKQNDVLPGHTGAKLRLSNGKEIILDSAGNGLLAKEGSLNVVNHNGVIEYNGDGAQANPQEIIYNDITTDKGRHWRLALPDGTIAWLNAASSIHYPLRFTGKQRLVEIKGEVYFEVKHDAAQPFRVKAGNQLIEDIGTSFNVNAYSDEAAVRTTLLEGIVTVNQTRLKPGEQYENGKLRIVNTSDVIAWKNGFFAFTDADIKTVMRQLARWYDVEVSYEGETGSQSFTGEIDNSLTLGQILDHLSDSKVHFRLLDGKKIVIIP